jgi:hypothetical protein
MNRLVRLYPRWWRERYEDEFTDLLTALRAERGAVGCAVDVVRGALDARLQRRPDMRFLPADTALRRGGYAGAAIATVMTVVLVLSNVAFPRNPAESDNDPEYLRQLAAGYLLLLVLFLAIGAYAGRFTGDAKAGVKGGAAAGLVIAVVVLVVMLVVDNAFLDVVSQQHDKRVAFAASGYSSMRTFLNMQKLMGAAVLVPGATGLGAALGALGGVIVRFRSRQQPDAAG